MRRLPLSGQVVRVVCISSIAVALKASSQQHCVLCCCHAFTEEVEGKGPVVCLEGLLQMVQVLQIGVQPILKPAVLNCTSDKYVMHNRSERGLADALLGVACAVITPQAGRALLGAPAGGPGTAIQGSARPETCKV